MLRMRRRRLGEFVPEEKNQAHFLKNSGRSIVGPYVYVFIRQVSLTQPSSF